MPTFFLKLIRLLCIALIVSACGQKGPLYLPEPDETPPPQEQPAAPEKN